MGPPALNNDTNKGNNDLSNEEDETNDLNNDDSDVQQSERISSTQSLGGKLSDNNENTDVTLIDVKFQHDDGKPSENIPLPQTDEVHEQEAPTIRMDENFNPIIDTDILKLKDSHGKKFKPVEDYGKSGSGFMNFLRNKKNFIVYNVFGDFARFVGIKKPLTRKVKKKVKFEDHVIQRAELRGETSPGVSVNTIPLTKYSSRNAAYSQKKEKAIRFNHGPEFKPTLAWIRDTNACEAGCEKLLLSFTVKQEYAYSDTKTVYSETRKRSSKKTGKRKKKKRLTKITASFLIHANVAETYLSGHKSRTLSYALKEVDFENEIQPILSEFEYSDELKPLSRARLGKLAGNIWVITNCIPLLFASGSELPTESSFRRLMEKFAGIALSASDGAKDIILQSKDFHNYSAEAMRIIRNLQLKIYLQGDTTVGQPVTVGSGLKFMSKDIKLSLRPHFQIQVAKLDGNTQQDYKWQRFEDLDITTKILAVKSLLATTLVSYDTAKHQIEFLVDDCKETTMDFKNNTDLLYRLSEMYNAINHIISKANSNATEKLVKELNLVSEAMSKFSMSLSSFIKASEYVMNKIMEVRDMIQLAYTYLQTECNIDLSKLMPPDNPVKIGATGASKKNKFKRNQSCCSRNKARHVKGLGTLPNYDGKDLFYVYYEDNFDKIIDADGFVFRVQRSVKNKPPTLNKLKFRNSEPSNLFYMSKSSIESIVTLEDEIVPEPVLKPILKAVASPTGSNTSIEMKGITEGSDQGVPRKGQGVKANSFNEDTAVKRGSND